MDRLDAGKPFRRESQRMGSSQITHIAVKSVLTAQNPRSSLPYDYTMGFFAHCTEKV